MKKITVGTINIGNKSKELLNKIIDSNRLSMGKYVTEFEKLVADLLKIEHVAAVNTGTAALSVACSALYHYGAKRNDEIIVPALTFISTANAVLEAGFKPVFIDVTINSMTINPTLIEKIITPRTKAIIPVHLFGKPANMDSISDIAHRYNLFVIEDAAESFGSKYKDKYTGSIGEIGCFSFYVAHIISTIEGGAVCTNDIELINIFRSLRAHGRGCTCETCILNTESGYCEKRFSGGYDSRFHFIRKGFSAKMNELEAAIGIEQLEQFEEITDKRHKNLLFLNKYFVKYNDMFSVMNETADEKIIPLAYPIIVKNQKYFLNRELIEYLERHNIETRPMFKSIPTQQPAYSDFNHKIGEFPNSEFIGNYGFYIGIHQNLEEDDLNFVIETFENFLKIKFLQDKSSAKKSAIIIFTFNNEKDIKSITDNIQTLIPGSNIYFLDRGSTDNTVSLVKSLNYKIFNLSDRDIFAYIKEKIFEEYIIFVEAGGVHNIRDISKILSKLDENYDMVIASRFLLSGHFNVSENIKFARGIGNRLFTLICNTLFNGNITDSITLYRGIRRKNLMQMDITSCEYDSFFRMTIQALKQQLKIYEFETWEKSRTSGRNKRNFLLSIFELIKIIISETIKKS
ncbi:MAG: DegT/DnrJ/EryC1/StrS family aminotransferase [Elusimicrobiota bacterium]